MFTETTTILLGLFAACEVCTLIVFCYQRTVRKLSLRLRLAQSALNVCYPPWMLVMHWATFSKYAIAAALLIIDWRCALVAAGVYVLSILISACITVPDGANLIKIYKEIKKRNSEALDAGFYQTLISEIEKGIIATGGDLARLNDWVHEDLEWNTKLRVNDDRVRQVGGSNSIQDKESHLVDVLEAESSATHDEWSTDRRKKILESKDIRKYHKLFKEAPTSVKISVAIWSLWVIVGLVLGFTFEESIQSNVRTAFVNVLFIVGILRGIRWVRNFYAIGVLLFAILIGANAISSESFIDDATVISIIINCLIAVVYICPLFTKSAHSWFYGNRKDSSENKTKVQKGEIAYQLLNEKPIPLVDEKKLIVPGHDVFGKIKYYIKKFEALLPLFAVAVFLLLLIDYFVSNAISETWRKKAEGKGRELYAAITKANEERKEFGLKWLWPQAADETLSCDKEDLAGNKFVTAAEYFSELFHVAEYFTNNWKPYIVADLSIVKLGEPCSFKSIRQGLKSEDIGWCVVQNLTEREDERTPVLISANFNCNFIPQSWDGITNAKHHIPYDDSCSGCLAKMDYVIIVRKNGDVLSVAKDKLSLRALFGSRPIQFNRNLSYLTPNGVSLLHKSPNDRR